MDSCSGEKKALDKKRAQAIINSLSSGTVPLQYVNCYNVGRQNQVRVVKREIEDKNSKLRFVNGDYGTGKTHFLATIRHWAIENNYMPSHVILSPRGTPLYDLRAVYSRIVKNLTHHEQWDISPMQAILEFIFLSFQTWLNKDYKGTDLRCEKSHLQILHCAHCKETGKIEELYIKNFKKLNPSLQKAITVYRSARWGSNPDFETADLVIRWIEGESFYRRELNYLGVWEDLNKGDIFKGLDEISKLITLIGKNGMIILLDEAEGIEKLTPYQRPQAYKNLQWLIEGVSKVDNIYFLYATTPAFYHDIVSYSGNLAELIKTTPRTDLATLSSSELKKLAHSVVKIYITSLGGDIDINDEGLMKFIEQYSETSTELFSVRKFITDLINELQEHHRNF